MINIFWGWEKQMKEPMEKAIIENHLVTGESSWMNPLLPEYDVAVHIGPVGNNNKNNFDVVHAAGATWMIIGGSSNHHVPQEYVMSMVRTSIHSYIAKNHIKMSKGIPAMIDNVMKDVLLKWNILDRSTVAIAAMNDTDFYFSNLNNMFYVYRQVERKIESLDRNKIWNNSNSTRDQIDLRTGDIMVLVSGDMDSDLYKDYSSCLQECFSDVIGKTSNEIINNLLSERDAKCVTEEITMVVVRRADIVESTKKH